jgi:hypothetical protein
MECEIKEKNEITDITLILYDVFLREMQDSFFLEIRQKYGICRWEQQYDMKLLSEIDIKWTTFSITHIITLIKDIIKTQNYRMNFEGDKLTFSFDFKFGPDSLNIKIPFSLVLSCKFSNQIGEKINQTCKKLNENYEAMSLFQDLLKLIQIENQITSGKLLILFQSHLSKFNNNIKMELEDKDQITFSDDKNKLLKKKKIRPRKKRPNEGEAMDINSNIYNEKGETIFQIAQKSNKKKVRFVERTVTKMHSDEWVKIFIKDEIPETGKYSFKIRIIKCIKDCIILGFNHNTHGGQHSMYLNGRYVAAKNIFSNTAMPDDIFRMEIDPIEKKYTLYKHEIEVSSYSLKSDVDIKTIRPTISLFHQGDSVELIKDY